MLRVWEWKSYRVNIKISKIQEYHIVLDKAHKWETIEGGNEQTSKILCFYFWKRNEQNWQTQFYIWKNKYSTRVIHYPRYWIDLRAKLITSKRPSRIKALAFSSPLLTESSLHNDCQNCISIGERKTAPDFALSVTEMFSIKSEYIISKLGKPLQRNGNILDYQNKRHESRFSRRSSINSSLPKSRTYYIFSCMQLTWKGNKPGRNTEDRYIYSTRSKVAIHIRYRVHERIIPVKTFIWCISEDMSKLQKWTMIWLPIYIIKCIIDRFPQQNTLLYNFLTPQSQRERDPGFNHTFEKSTILALPPAK